MKKARRYLGLFLVGVLSLSNIPPINVWADNDTANLKFSVAGKGTVIVDDSESQYTLTDGDVFNADYEEGKTLKISLDAEDGNSIQEVIVNGEEDSNVEKGGQSFSMEYSVPKGGAEIKVAFSNEEANIPVFTGDERSREEQSINQYIEGVKMLPEQIEMRKKKAEELNLLDYVDENYFLTDKWYEGRSEADINDLGANILVDTVTNKELDAWANNLLQGIAPMTVTKYEMVSANGSTVGKYEVDGKMAFCAQHSASSPAKGAPTSNKRVNTKSSVRKVLYYGYGGPKKLSDITGNAGWVTTTLGLSYAYTGSGGPKAKAFVDRVNKLAEPPSSFKVYIHDTNKGSTQDLATWEYNPTGKLSLEKSSAIPSMTDGNSCYSLNGAVYGVYKNSNATNKVGELKTNASGKSNTLTLAPGTYYIKEITAPKGYALDKTVHSIKVTDGGNAVGKYKDRPQSDPIGILLKKIDAGTGASKPIDGASLQDARFTLKWFKGHYDGNPEAQGVKPDWTWVFKTDEDGFSYFSEEYKVSGPAFWYNGTNQPTLPLGTVTIQETQAPKGYKINPEVFVRKITATGNAENVHTFNEPIIKEESLDFKIIKVEEGTNKRLGNVTFRHTKPNGTTQELKTNSNGEIVIRGLEQGTHKILETKTLDGYELNSNEFVFEVTSSNTIRVISNTTNMGMSYRDVKGSGELTVENKLNAPFKLKVVKVNDKNKSLEGAEFTLYSDKECNNQIGKAVSNQNGELVFKDLEVGTKYYLKETKAPAGYRIPVGSNGKPHVYEVVVQNYRATTGEMNFTVDGVKYTSAATSGNVYVEGANNDRAVCIKVVNYLQMKLPGTGSNTMIPLLVVGAALMGIALVLNKKQKGKKEN
ncbi:SpaA isopeptide-forming pilin-related protein [Clostridium baratii]